MQRCKKIFLITLLFYLLFTNTVFAYLDPVTGAVILKFIAWVFAGFVAYCVLFWKKFKSFVSFIKKKLNKLT